LLFQRACENKQAHTSPMMHIYVGFFINKETLIYCDFIQFLSLVRRKSSKRFQR